LIKHMPDGYISHNPSITIQNGRKTLGAFDTIREKALAEFEQAEYGLDLGLDFATKLHDPKTKVVVFSIDINSTINDRETAANTALLDKTLAELQFMAEEMKTTYGDKKAVLLVLNTGRPALYAWGTAEMLPPIPELRVFGMAEAGGVVFKIEDTQLKAETPVEDPQAWFDELQRINHHLQEKINGTARTEPKLSMLSMELANREGGTFIHETTDGEIVTPEWIANEVTTYLQQTHDQLEQELEIVANRMTKVPYVTDFINQLKKSRLDGNTAQTRDYLQQVLQEEEQELQDRLEAAITSLHTIDIMKASLTCSFNPTAGFIDIGNKNFNKFSTLLGEVKKIGFTYEEALIVHIGDSSTDNPPVDNLEPGQPNEGVDSIYLVAVGNSTQKLKNAAQIRGEKGRITARDAILGLDDTIKGIQRALKQYPVAA
ncbi:MAG: hypothetical protein KBD46_03410, partial [Candidatus Levybacteria bacterium]|nr:hypothetical protein [Candidatus Levybacteria bacterium]